MPHGLSPVLRTLLGAPNTDTPSRLFGRTFVRFTSFTVTGALQHSRQRFSVWTARISSFLHVFFFFKDSSKCTCDSTAITYMGDEWSERKQIGMRAICDSFRTKFLQPSACAEDCRDSEAIWK